jgi:hypothetical protein
MIACIEIALTRAASCAAHTLTPFRVEASYRVEGMHCRDSIEVSAATASLAQLKVTNAILGMFQGVSQLRTEVTS